LAARRKSNNAFISLYKYYKSAIFLKPENFFQVDLAWSFLTAGFGRKASRNLPAGRRLNCAFRQAGAGFIIKA
jgi:hypothetical protein